MPRDCYDQVTDTNQDGDLTAEDVAKGEPPTSNNQNKLELSLRPVEFNISMCTTLHSFRKNFSVCPQEVNSATKKILQGFELHVSRTSKMECLSEE